LLLTLSLPRINDHMSTAVIEAIYITEGGPIGLGSKLLDLRVDLSAVFAHDCPPVSFYRIAVRERIWLRRLYVARTNEIEVGALLGIFSTGADEPLDREAARPVRVGVAGILAQSNWWDDGRP
jgi:hypothetical protein